MAFTAEDGSGEEFGVVEDVARENLRGLVKKRRRCVREIRERKEVA